MKRQMRECHRSIFQLSFIILCLLAAGTFIFQDDVLARDAAAPPLPVVAIHVSELTQTLESMPAKPPTPTGPDATGFEWFYTSWHYFVAYESLKEALRSDGTPFVEITDADIRAGALLYPDGSPRYPIVISLASEAISDNEIAPLRDYVNGGGFLFIGSSSFTRYPDGSTRGDFALANEMGIHMVSPSIFNWNVNMGFLKHVNHRLVNGIPEGEIYWRMPLTSEEIPLGVSPSRVIHGEHSVWVVSAGDATVVASGYSSPLVTVKQYGKGNFIYHSVFQPLVGHGGFDAGMYSYLIYRNAIEWAFESANVPIIKVSPWQYQYDAAFIVRHDFENFQNMIRSIEASAAFEHSLGAKGDYYFCTGTLREHMADKNTVISSLRRAVSNYGATIGSHNGGLKNPVNLSLSPYDYDYWHWGPDEALDVTPAGYPSGKAYAEASIETSFLDVEEWLTGLDNGRSGCGATGDCPRTWVSPCFNSTREDSYDILQQLGVATTGEQKISPFPHWTISTQTAGLRYGQVTLPVSEWYKGDSVLQTLDEHTSSTMRAAVDFYYNLGALINLYGHNNSASGNLQGEYVSYCAAKPRIWATNSVGIYDWWHKRSNVIVNPMYSEIENTGIARATVDNISGTDTAIEIKLPASNGCGGCQVFVDDSPADSNSYRIVSDGVKIRAGTANSSVEVRYPLAAVQVNIALTLSPTSVIGGNPATGTVTLSAPAPTGGAVVSLSSSNTSAATVPSSVTIASGSTSATFTVTTTQVSASTSASITAGYAGKTATASLSVTAIQLNSLTLSPTSVIGGNPSTGTVTLSAAAPTGGAMVSLSSSNTSAATVPSSVTIASGSTSATFTVTTRPVSSLTTATISARYNGATRSSSLTVRRASLASISVNPSSVVSGGIATGTAALDGPAPTGGAVVSLSSSNTSAATVPSSVTIASGSTSATFTIATQSVSSSTSVTITGSYSGTTRTASLTVTPGAPQLSSLSLNPTSVVGGNSSTGTVTLSVPAPTGGAVVSLSSSNTSAATVPSSVTIASGSTSATFTIATQSVSSSTSVTITGSYSGTTRTASLAITTADAQLLSLTLNPATVKGGNSSTGTVTLSAPAPTGGAVVSLSSSNTSAATVPSSVTIASGSTSATFTIATRVRFYRTSVTISARYGGVTKTAVLTVTR